MLDPRDIEGTRAGWLSASVRAAEMAFGQSSTIAESYVTSYQVVETAGGDVLVVPRFDAARVANDLDLAGTQYMKSLIREGHTPESAHAAAYSRMMGVARNHAMDGGRSLIEATTSQDRRAIGYRRVTDGDPCTFCAMLASRGAHFGAQRAHGVYSSADTALVRASDGRKYHIHCGCTAEIVYGHWEPNEREQRYVDAYERAVKELDRQNLPREQTSVLQLMRADDEAALRDSSVRRNKNPASE